MMVFLFSLCWVFWWTGAIQAGFVDGFMNPISLSILAFMIAFVIHCESEIKREKKQRKQKWAQERANLPPIVSQKYEDIEDWFNSKEYHQLCFSLCGIP